MKKGTIRRLTATSLMVGSAIAPFAIANSGQAAPPPDVFRAPDGDVIIHGATAPAAGLSLPVEFVGEGRSSRLRANYCGEVAITITSSRPNLGNSLTITDELGTTNVDISTLTEQTRPRCVGQTLEEPRTGNYVTPDGDVILMGRTPGLYSEVSFNDLNRTSNRRSNGCGFIQLSNSARNPLPAVLKIDGTDYTIATLQEADPPVCRGNSTQGYTNYTPDTWAP